MASSRGGVAPALLVLGASSSTSPNTSSSSLPPPPLGSASSSVCIEKRSVVCNSLSVALTVDWMTGSSSLSRKASITDRIAWPLHGSKADKVVAAGRVPTTPAVRCVSSALRVSSRLFSASTLEARPEYSTTLLNIGAACEAEGVKMRALRPPDSSSSCRRSSIIAKPTLPMELLLLWPSLCCVSSLISCTSGSIRWASICCATSPSMSSQPDTSADVLCSRMCLATSAALTTTSSPSSRTVCVLRALPT
mmetsp:Transcript_22563/g.50168  ORF Transcript_22563/g.50168 Transcript_22563/m.50168 type:complete len:250 (-) Transcript_22563:458-1207(-)